MFIKLSSKNILFLFMTANAFPLSRRLSKGEFLDFDLNLVTSTVHIKSGSIIVRFAFSPSLNSGIGCLIFFLD